jgi:poly-gamma-glutamate system protein
MVMVYWAVNSYEQHETYGFDLKVKAVENMENAINSLREEFIIRGINNGEDSLAFGSFLLGPQNSIIQTTKGSKVSKLSTLNPNFAAMIMEMLIELEVDSSSKVAVSYTGSYPGANIAVLSALEAMNMDASIITSCGSSEWGATYSEMTWMGMENYLNQEYHISNKSKLGSIGGGLDVGIQLNREGKEVCESAIYSNDIEPLHEKDFIENVKKRMQYYYRNNELGVIDLFINVGGGIYTIGDSLKRNNLPVGIIYPGDINLDINQTVLEGFLDKDIPVININHIERLMEWYELPYPPNKKNKIKTGILFYSHIKYNLKVILTAFIIAAGTVLFVGIVSHREIKKRMHSSEPESIL